MNDLDAAALALDFSRKPMDEPLKTEVLQNWNQNTSYICRTCRGPSYMERGGHLRFGCPTCGYTTINPEIQFQKAAA